MEPFVFETKPHRNTGDKKIHVPLVFFFNLHSLLWSIEGEKRVLNFLILTVLLFVQAYSGTPPAEEKEKIIWVRFENADLNGMASFSLTYFCDFWVHVQ